MTSLSLLTMLTLVAPFPLAGSTSVLKPPRTSNTSVQQVTRPSPSWLDRTPVNWNQTAGGMPQPDSNVTLPQGRRCRDFVRQPDGPAEEALVRAGWILYGAAQLFGPTRVFGAMSGVDGMCRPLGYQAFVYRDGRYAGTLSPVSMNSRTDGALTNFRLMSATSITAEFVRYNESDPLCCPTRISHVTYEVGRDYVPVVTPLSVRTETAPRSESGPAADDSTSLFGRRWKLTEIDGSPTRSTPAYIQFDREAKRFTGNSGCNQISGGFDVEGTNLKFSQAVSTRRACLDQEIQQVETNLLNRLERATRFQIQDDILRLSAGRGPILTFRADASGGTGPPVEARVKGTVTYRQRSLLSPLAVVEVKLLDVTRADAPAQMIAEQSIKPGGKQVPIEFDLSYDPARIQERNRYVIQVRILELGFARFITTEAYPVITGGNPNTVNVVVTPAGR